MPIAQQSDNAFFGTGVPSRLRTIGEEVILHTSVGCPRSDAGANFIAAAEVKRWSHARPKCAVNSQRGGVTRGRYCSSHVRPPPGRPHDSQACGVLLAGRRRRHGADVPVRRRIGAGVQPGLRSRRQRLGAASRGRGARGVDDGRREGQHHRLAVLAAPLRGAQRQDRQHDEAGDRLHRGQAVRRPQRGGLEGHADRAGRLRARRRRHPRRFDHRAAVHQELPIAGDRQDRRREARRRRNHPGAQAARDPDGAHAGQDLHQARDPHPLPESGLVRQRLVRCAGRGADLLRHQRLGPELAAGGAAGGHGAVDQRAQPLHQPRRCVGAAKLGAGHHDREHPAGGRRAARRQGHAAGRYCRSPTSCRAAASRPATARSSATTSRSTCPAPGSARNRWPAAAT